MAHLTLAQVQQWLQSTKLNLQELDAVLEASQVDYVFGRLGSIFDTSGWSNETTTPPLVQDILSMLIAAVIYRRSYAEVIDDETLTYPAWLETRAEQMISCLLSGQLQIPGVPLLATTQPLYLPTELTGMTQQYDAAGNMVGWNEFSEDIKFRMGAKF